MAILPIAQHRSSNPVRRHSGARGQREPGISPPHISGFRVRRAAPSWNDEHDRTPTMATHKLLLLPGDGIGPEVMAEVKRLIGWLSAQGIAHFETEEGLVGGAAYDAHKVSISEDTMAKAQAADVVIFGAVGGPKWDNVPYDARPEA